MTNYRPLADNGWTGAALAGNSDSSVNLGCEFIATSNCWITEVRWWQASSGAVDTGNHTGGLWSVNPADESATLLGSSAATAPVGTGWQTLTLTTPVAVTTGVHYRVGVLSPAGGYIAESLFWATGGGAGSAGLTSGPVTSVKQNDAIAGHQGSFHYASGLAMPDGQFNAANYGVDFTATDVDPSGGTSTVTSDSDLRWRVANAITSDSDLRWRVKAAITSDSDLRWAVRNIVTSDSDLRWKVLALVVISDSDLRWRVRGIVTSDSDLRWAIKSVITSDVDLRWAVGGKVASDLDLRWGVTSGLTSDADLRWAVRSGVASDSDLRWRVLGRVTADLDLRWAVGGRVLADLDLRWRIRPGTDRNVIVVGVLAEQGRLRGILAGQGRLSATLEEQDG